jgi:PAS domain S-box-containing protein
MSIPDPVQKCSYELFDYAPAGICIIDREFRVVHWNNCLEDWTRVNRTGMIGTDLRDFCPMFRQEYYRKRIESVFSSGAPVVFSPQLHKDLFPVRLYDGTSQIQRIKLTILPPVDSNTHHALFSIEDVTEVYRKIHEYRLEHETALREVQLRTEAEKELRRSLEMKDFLIKELPHRVKNNLALVASLLSLQKENLHDPRDASVLDELRDKISSVSLVHEKLYGGSKLRTINFREYLSDLLPILSASTLSQDRGIRITHSISSVEVSLDTAVPLALIVTELFINAVKYAFPQHSTGTITISFTPSSDTLFTLSVRDDGIGLPDDFDFYKAETLGSKLIVSFAEQLSGEISIVSDTGTEISIRFPRQVIIPPPG